jgi:transposase
MTGESSALLSTSVNTEDMNEHLRFISEQVDSNVHVVLVVDNAGWHSAKNLRIPQKSTLFYLPAYSPELNPVERLWSYLKSHFLSNRAYSDYDDLFSACRDAWNRLTVEQLCSICQTEWLMHEK